MPDWLLPAIASGAASGLIFYGAIRVELRWLRRDVDDAHWRINEIVGDRRRTRRNHHGQHDENDE